MAEHTSKHLSFMKAEIACKVDSETKTFWVDIKTPEQAGDVSVGWSPKWDKFGVYVDGHEVFPRGFEEDPPVVDSLADIIEIAEAHAHEGRGDNPTRLGLVSMALLDVIIEGTRNAKGHERDSDPGDEVA